MAFKGFKIIKQFLTPPALQKRATMIPPSKQAGNVFLALFGAVAIVGVIGVTATGIMQGPMKVMSNTSARAIAESEIISNTKMAVMSIAKESYTRDCDNDGIIEPFPFNSDATGKIGGVPTGGGYLPDEIDTVRRIDPWGNHYTYCVWDHGAAVDDALCGGTGQNRSAGLNAADPNKQTLMAVLSGGPNRKYETTCQDWAVADSNADGDLDDVGDTQLINKPNASDDLIMSFTYAEAAMATSANWRIQTSTTGTAEITEDDIEVGGQTALGAGVSASIAGGVNVLGGLKLATDPGDNSISGSCNVANDQALRVNTGGASKTLEICVSGAWQAVSGASTTSLCSITAPVIAGGGAASIQDNTDLDNASSIALDGGYAFVTAYDGDRVTVLDITNPLAPIIADSGNAWITDAVKLNGANDIKIRGNYAYVASALSNALTVIDISDPLNPVIANAGNAWIQDAVKLNGANAIQLEGNYAYVTSAAGDSLTVVDISDPLNPIIANSGNAWITDATNLNGANSVQVSGNYAYVTSGTGNSFTVIDISDPLNPAIANAGSAVLIDAAQLSGANNNLVIDDYAYVTSGIGNSLTVIDISNPLVPVIANAGSAWIQDGTRLNGANNLTIAQNSLLITGDSGNSLAVIDINNPLNPLIADSGDAWLQDATNLNGANSLQINGQYAYITAGGGNRVSVIDLGCDPDAITFETGTDIGFDPSKSNCLISNNQPLTQIASATIPSGNTTIYGDGQYLYINSYNGNTVKAFKQDSGTLSEVASYSLTTTASNANAIWGDGTYIFASTGGGITALTFDGATFSEITNTTLGTQILNLWFDGTFFYAANGTAGLRVFDFDGANFNLLATSTNHASSVWGDSTYIYTGSHDTGTDAALTAYIFDGTDLTQVARRDETPARSSIYHDGNYIYIGSYDDAQTSVYQFDGKNFSALTQENITTSGAHGDGRYLYTSAPSQARVYDYKGAKLDPLQTFPMTSTGTNTPFTDGQYVYFASTNGTLRAYSGHECFVAGEKTPGTLSRITYDTEQRITSDGENPIIAGNAAESHATTIAVRADNTNDKAGLSIRADTTIGEDEIADVSITGARGLIGNEGALIVATPNNNDVMTPRTTVGSNGNLGIDASDINNIQSKIQIGDLNSSNVIFNPEKANCDINQNGALTLQTTNGGTLANASDVWANGEYVFVSRGSDGIFAYEFDGVDFTEIDSDAGHTSLSVHYDGTYLYSGGASGLFIYSFNGTALTLIDSDTQTNVSEILSDGTYTYASTNTSPGKIIAYTFDGSDLSEVNSFTAPSGSSFSRMFLYGDTIFAGTGSTNILFALQFDGTDFIEIDRYTAARTDEVWVDGETIFTAGKTGGLNVLKFDGKNFSLTYDQTGADIVNTTSVFYDGVYVYAHDDPNDTINVYEFDGTTLNLIDSTAAPTNEALRLWGNGQYLFSAHNTGGVAVHSGYACLKSTPWVGPSDGLLASNPNFTNFDPKASSCISKNGSGFTEISRITSKNNSQIRSLKAENSSIYYTELTGSRNYNFDGARFKEIAFSSTGGNVGLDRYDNYFISGNRGSGINAYNFPNFNGGSLAADTTYDFEDIWASSAYIMAASDDNFLSIFNFDGSNFTLVDDFSPLSSGSAKVMEDGTYIYVADAVSGLRAFTFDGTTLTQVGLYNSSGTANDAWSDGSYIYIADGASGVHALSFDGSTFTLIDTYDTPDRAESIWSDGSYIYVADNAGGIIALEFDGAALTLFAQDDSENIDHVWGDGNYIYATNDNELIAYSGFACTQTSDGLTKGATGFFGNSDETENTTNILYSQSLYIKASDATGETLTDILTIDQNGTATFEQGGLDLINDAGTYRFSSGAPSSDNAPSISLNRARGTRTAPATLNNGDILGALLWAGYDGTDIADDLGMAAIYDKVTGAPAANTIPQGLFLSVDTGGNTANALGSSDVALMPNGRVGIGTELPTETLHVDGRLSMTNGLRIGNDNKCNGGYDFGFIRYDDGTSAVEYCNGLAWQNLTDIYQGRDNGFDPRFANCALNEGGPASLVTNDNTNFTDTNHIWQKDGYVYIADGTNGLKVTTFNGTDFILIDTYVATDITEIWIDDNDYIYTTNAAGGLNVFTFDGTSLTLADSITSGLGIQFALWGDEGYIYTTSTSGGLYAFTFDGATLTQIASNTTDFTNTRGIWGDGTYLYAADYTAGLDAVSFDGSSFTVINTYNGTGNEEYIWGDDNYIYLSREEGGIAALSFDGSSFSEIDTIDPANRSIGGIWTDGTYIYATSKGTGADIGLNELRVYSFDGATLTQEQSLSISGDGDYKVWGDGEYIYSGHETNGVNVYSGFTCQRVKITGTSPLEFGGTMSTERKLTASDGNAGDNFSYNISQDGSYILTSANQDNDLFSNGGSAYLYDARTLAQIHKFTPSDATANGYFGAGIKTSGSYSVIGAHGADGATNDSGAIYVFDNQDGSELRKLFATDGDTNDFFGFSLYIDQDLVLVGSLLDDDNGSDSGSAYIFNYLTGEEILKLTPSDGQAGDNFGSNVSLYNDIAVIGAYQDDDNGPDSGSVYLFNANTGEEITKITPSDGAAGDNFGFPVDIDENYIAASAYSASNPGSVYIFDHDGNEIRKITSKRPIINGSFGSSLSIDNGLIAIGEQNGVNQVGDNTGAAYIFDIATGQEITKITSSDGNNADLFGNPVSLYNNQVIIGAVADDDNGSNAGAVYIYNGQWTDRYTNQNNCYPDSIAVASQTNVTTSTTITTDPLTITGVQGVCTLTLSSDSDTIDIILNGVSVAAPYTDIRSGDTLEFEIESASAAATTYKNIIKIGDSATIFDITTAP